MSEQLSHISGTSWDAVLTDWRNREANLWGWETHWQAKGFQSWDAWREGFYKKLDLQNKEWNLYRINNPRTFIPTMWAVAYNGWRRYYNDGVTRATFSELVKHVDLSKNNKVADLLNDFPNETTIIILRNENKFAVFEGMHRCSAFTLAQEQGRVINSQITAAVADVDETTFNQITTQQPK